MHNKYKKCNDTAGTVNSSKDGSDWRYLQYPYIYIYGVLYMSTRKHFELRNAHKDRCWIAASAMLRSNLVVYRTSAEVTPPKNK